MMNYIGIQRKLKHIGDEGCYWLSLLKAAGYDGDILSAYDECLSGGLIEEDCYVIDPVAVLNKYAYFNVRSVSKTTSIVDNPVVVIGQWERGTYRHFGLVKSPVLTNDCCVLSGDGYNVYDPLGDSNTIRHGKLISYRCFYG